MYAKLEARFGGRPPTPTEILADDPEQLRVAVGLSHAKASYLRSLAEHLLDGSLELDALPAMTDGEVIAKLTAIRGLGLWSAQLFLIFYLQRPDVVASGDLGIRRAVMIEYALPAAPKPAHVEQLAQAWRPHRTLAGLLLWRSIATTPT